MMVTAVVMMVAMITCQIDLSTATTVTHISFQTLHCAYTTVNSPLGLECFWWVNLT